MKIKANPIFRKVMVIDDDEIDLFIASHLIMQSNFGEHVIPFSLPLDALKFLQDNEDNISVLPQVIFVDINMPLMTGFQFMAAYALLSPKLRNNCHVFMLSSSSDAKDIHQARSDKNIVAFERKPLTLEFLANCVA